MKARQDFIKLVRDLAQSDLDGKLYQNHGGDRDLDNSTYKMFIETLGRSFNAINDQWDEKNNFTKNVNDELFWLKYFRRVIQERVNEIKRSVQIV